MTALEQVQFDQIPTEDAETPAWVQYRQQRGERQGDHAIPRGTYEATLIEATLVRRKDGSGHLIRLVARTNDLGKYCLGWRGLGTNSTDPFNLTEAEVKSLRKFAQSMGIPTPAPALTIVQTLQGMCGHPVMAKVVHTPVGIQATLYRDDAAEYATPPASTFRVGGQLVVANGRAIDEDGHALEGAAADAFVAHSQVLESQQLVRQAVATGAKGCYELQRSEGWLALGFATLSEYLAQPELEISRSEFYRLAKIHETYVLTGGMDPVALAGASSSKLELPIPAIEQGVVSAEQGAADAEALTRNELRTRYRELLGTENDPDPVPERVEEKPVLSVVAESEPRSHRRDVEDREREEFDGLPIDADELVQWAENYGHPEAWAKKAQALNGTVEAALIETRKLREAAERAQDEFAELQTRADAAEEREARLQGELEQLQGLEDAAQVETVLAAAKTVALTLRRVLVEIGDPKQKRMGRDLRTAVLAALDEAREHGLDEGE